MVSVLAKFRPNMGNFFPVAIFRILKKPTSVKKCPLSEYAIFIFLTWQEVPEKSFYCLKTMVYLSLPADFDIYGVNWCDKSIGEEKTARFIEEQVEIGVFPVISYQIGLLMHSWGINTYFGLTMLNVQRRGLTRSVHIQNGSIDEHMMHMMQHSSFI